MLKQVFCRSASITYLVGKPTVCYDVFRLTELIDPTAKIVAPKGVYADIQEFVQRMKNENVDIKQLGLVGRTKEKILEELKEMYDTILPL